MACDCFSSYLSSSCVFDPIANFQHMNLKLDVEFIKDLFLAHLFVVY